MNCLQARLRIAALLDGSLEEHKARQLGQHLESCPACARFQQEQLALSRELGSLEPFPLDPPAAIWANIQSSIEGSSQGWRDTWERFIGGWSVPQLRYAGAGVMILVLCSLAVLRLSVPPNGHGQVLAELAAFGLSVEGNPFLATIDGQDEFLRFDATGRANPFSPGEEAP